jgi:hypothetical protein
LLIVDLDSSTKKPNFGDDSTFFIEILAEKLIYSWFSRNQYFGDGADTVMETPPILS